VQSGLSRHELEREMTWLLRRLPHDPSTMPAALAELVVTLIDKNNAALANDLARRDPPRDEPADY
jgi:hypothetical protein